MTQREGKKGILTGFYGAKLTHNMRLVGILLMKKTIKLSFKIKLLKNKNKLQSHPNSAGPAVNH